MAELSTVPMFLTHSLHRYVLATYQVLDTMLAQRRWAALLELWKETTPTSQMNKMDSGGHYEESK